MQSRSIVRACALFGIFVACGPVLAQPATLPAPGKVIVEETSLGSIAGFESVRNIAMSLDASHVAFVGGRDKQQFVIQDGKAGPAFDFIIPESLEFSPDGQHLAYLIQTSSETQPVIDGKVGKGFYNISRNRIYWSRDGKHTALAVQFQGGGGAIVVDGAAGPTFDAADFPSFSPDSQRVGYVAKREKQFVVLDGKEQKAYDAVGRLTFSPNSKHLTYEAVISNKALLVMDALEGAIYDSIKIGPGFSADGAKLIAVAAKNGKLLVLINGREIGPYEALLVGDFVLSPDGKRSAYAIKQGVQQFVIIDGVPQQAFEHIGANSLSFSPDSKRFAYEAGTGKEGSEFIIVDGVRQKDCDGVLAGTPFLSPDSKRVAYGAKRQGKWQMVVDGVDGKPYDVIEPPMTQMFSPDSRRIAYRAGLEVKGARSPLAVVDGVESGPAEKVSPIVFSPDSRHITYLHVREDKTYLVVDNVEVAGPYNPASPDMRIIFDDVNTGHFLATRKEEFLRVKVKLP